jgi:hypothetical protein
MKMKAYVLVHRGGHGGWRYQRVARILRAKGHDVSTPTLTGLGEREHLLAPTSTFNRRHRQSAALQGSA